MRAAVNYKQLDVGSGLPNARPHEEHVNPFLHRLKMSAWDWVKVRPGAVLHGVWDQSYGMCGASVLREYT